MTITTRFSEGDRIFFLQQNKILITTVRGVVSEKFPNKEVVVTYLCHESATASGGALIKVLETNAFSSKEDLVKSL